MNYYASGSYLDEKDIVHENEYQRYTVIVNTQVAHGSIHNPDIIFFLGDQSYESNAGYGVQKKP